MSKIKNTDDVIGNIVLHFDFDGKLKIRRGWMKCNGQIINQENYDNIHGPGSYESDNVASSPIQGKANPIKDSHVAGSFYIVKVTDIESISPKYFN